MLLFILCLFTVVVVIGVWTVFLKTSQRVMRIYRKKVETSDEQYKLAMKSINIIKWVAYPETGIIEINEHYTQLNSGFDMQNLMDRETFYNLIQPEHRARVCESFENLKAGKITVFHEEFCFCMGADVAPVWVETYATVNDKDDNGRPLSLVGATISIDKRKKREHELQEAKEMANEVNDMKTAFLANMSHEVRTPLNQIMGFSQALLVSQSDEDRQQCMSLIEQNTRALLSLFDTVLNISRLESNTYTFDYAETSLESFFSDLEQMVCFNYKESAVSFQVDKNIPGDMIYTDATCLYQLMQQLLSNAFKFTNRGMITVGCSKSLDGNVRFYVKDTGCGIAKEYLERIFDQFAKIDSFIQGAGLGLLYSKKLVEKMRGSIGCNSVLGVGSEFWFILPCDLKTK